MLPAKIPPPLKQKPIDTLKITFAASTNVHFPVKRILLLI